MPTMPRKHAKNRHAQFVWKALFGPMSLCEMPKAGLFRKSAIGKGASKDTSDRKQSEGYQPVSGRNVVASSLMNSCSNATNKCLSNITREFLPQFPKCGSSILTTLVKIISQ